LLRSGQRLGLDDDAGLVGLGQRRTDGRQFFVARAACFALSSGSGPWSAVPVRIFQQQLPGESRNENLLPGFPSATAPRADRCSQRGDGIAAVNRLGEGFHQQVQAVGKTSRDFRSLNSS